MFTEKCKGCSEHECSVPYLEQEIKEQRMRYVVACTLLKRWSGAMSGDTACPESIEALRADTTKFLR